MNGSLGDVLKIYFARIFPFDDLFKWLCYGEDKIFVCREVALNFEGERYLRNQAYYRIDDFKREIKKHRPVKIDIGAIYNTSPLNRLRTICYPVQRELAFDIDMTDYDEVRTCCSGVNICKKCWKFMIIAIKILDVALKEDFGFDHILWVYSGRRGIHGWVCDERARFLKSDGRYAVANYLQLVTGGEYKKKKVEIKDKIHPSVKRALQIIKPIFLEMCVKEQNMLGTDERVSKFLGIIDEEEMRIEVKEILDQHSTSLAKWEAFVNFFENQIQLQSEKWCRTPFLIEEIMIQYAYPRLDIHVTLGMTHLLKAPFCVHPKTGKIGVPIDVKDIEEFDPFTIPNVMELMEEIDTFDAKSRQQGMSIHELRNMKDIKKTCLNKYLHIFQDFISDLQNSNKEEIDPSDAEMSF